MSLHRIRLDVFEGPLDLLLRLIEREELDITTVALARVTDQYLDHLTALKECDAGDLTEFLVVAAKLVLIKSAALLPGRSDSSPDHEDEEASGDLVRQLQIYRQYKEAARLLQERETRGWRSYIRLVPPRRIDPRPNLDQVTIYDLVSLAQETLNVTPRAPVSPIVSPVKVTIQQQIDQIEQRLSRERSIVFRTLLSRATTRIEVIVTLLAVLELVKRDRVRVYQQTLFGEIIIQRAATPPNGADAACASPTA